MTPKAQRIAIARAHRAATGSHWWDFIYEAPDYLRDLNAMHEAEKTLTEAQRDEYTTRLKGIVSGFSQSELQYAWMLTFATAAQRAEAFLRTIGKWRDDSAPGKVIAI